MPVEKEPRWATWVTLLVVVPPVALIVSAMFWVIFKIWVDILHMTGC